MLCSWHTTLHYCSSQLIFSPTLPLRPPANNFYFYLLPLWDLFSDLISDECDIWIGTDSLHPQKYFFSSPQGCVGVIIILQKVLTNSHEFVRNERFPKCPDCLFSFLQIILMQMWGSFCPWYMLEIPFFISKIFAAYAARIYFYVRPYKLNYFLIGWPTFYLF